MKLYRRVARHHYRWMFPKGGADERKIRWGMSLRPGDLVAACTGFNVKIAKIRPIRRKVEFSSFSKKGFRSRYSSRGGWYISDFEITDPDGQLHHIMHCCWPKETVQQIETFWKEQLKGRADLNPYLDRIFRAVTEERRVCDDSGVRLPEFDPS